MSFSFPIAALRALLVFTLLAAPAFAAGPVLHVLVSYGPAAEGTQRAFTGRFIKLQTGNAGEGYAGKTLGTITANVLTILDPVTADTARPASELIAELKARIAANIGTMGSSMATQIRSQNASSGVMEYKQDVLLPNSQRGVLAWRLMVDSSGSVRYGDPEVLPVEALTLDVVYTPLNLSAVLPPSWPKYADAGLLKWRLIDKTGAARTGWTTVDAAGAYDDPESTATENVDPDAGLKCLILDRTRCGGPTDVKTLMDQQGAAGAYVAYTRRLTPLYDNVADPARPGEFIQQPRISLTVDNRELRYNGCGQNLTYRNQGAYGYTLAAHAEKYLVDATLRYYPVDWSDEARTSPTEPYDKSVSVPRSDIASVGATIITPGNSGSALVNVGDVAGITYLAPVTQNGSEFNRKSFVMGPYTGAIWSPNGGVRVGYDITCNESDGNYKVTAGVLDNGVPANTGYSSVTSELLSGVDRNIEYVYFTPGVAATKYIHQPIPSCGFFGCEESNRKGIYYRFVDVCDQSCVPTYAAIPTAMPIAITYDGSSSFSIHGVGLNLVHPAYYFLTATNTSYANQFCSSTGLSCECPAGTTLTSVSINNGDNGITYENRCQAAPISLSYSGGSETPQVSCAIGLPAARNFSYVCETYPVAARVRLTQ